MALVNGKLAASLLTKTSDGDLLAKPAAASYEGAVTAYLTAQLGAGATEADVTKFLNAKAVP